MCLPSITSAAGASCDRIRAGARAVLWAQDGCLVSALSSHLFDLMPLSVKDT